MWPKMILFLVRREQSVSEASEAAKTESVSAAKIKAAGLSTKAEQEVIGLTSGSGLLVTSEPGGGP